MSLVFILAFKRKIRSHYLIKIDNKNRFLGGKILVLNALGMFLEARVFLCL